MASNDYHFITHWRVLGGIEQVADILRDAPSLVHWWPSVYLDVTEIAPGNADGIGKVVDLYTTGLLPYTLRWQFEVVEVNYPYGFVINAWGDFTGRGVWTLAQDGPWVNVTYDWRIRADKPILRHLSFILKPIFSANHNWAMAKGEESLRLELDRRQAKTDEARQLIPAPPGPIMVSTDAIIFWGLTVVITGGIFYKVLRNINSDSNARRGNTESAG